MYLRVFLFYGLLMVWSAPIYAGSVMLAWDQTTLNEDESPCMDLAGYRLYHGLSSGVYDTPMTVGLVTQASMSGLDDGVTHYFAATAFDTAGNESSLFSNEVSVALPPGDSTPPMVSLTNPHPGTIPRKSTVTITADASDNVGVTRVEIWVNNSLLCADGVEPYSCTWQVPAPPKRTYQLQAKAFDAAGKVGLSAIVEVMSQ